MVEFRFQRIKELREANGMTLEEMAGKMGKQKQQLGIWENGIPEAYSSHIRPR